MTGVRRAMLSFTLVALLAGCGGGAESAAPSPAVASSPSAGPTEVEVGPTGFGTATAEPATTAPTPMPRPMPMRTPTPTPTKHAGPTATPGPTGATGLTTLRLTVEDAGRTITVRPGTVIVVELTGGAGSFHTPTTDAPTVLRAGSTSGGYPAPGPAVAKFTAIGSGTAQVTSTTDAACLHSQPACMIPQQQFTVTIRVR